MTLNVVDFGNRENGNKDKKTLRTNTLKTRVRIMCRQLSLILSFVALPALVFAADQVPSNV